MTVPAIGDYGLIGDCHAAALVSRDGAIDWCCLPRFDSGSCFGRLLLPEGGTCRVGVDGDSEPGGREYLEDTMVLATTLRAAGGEARLLDCLAIDEDRRLVLRVVEGVRGAVPLHIRIEPRFDYGEVEPWIRHHGIGLYSAIGGNDALLCSCDARLEPAELAALEARVTVRAGDRIRLALSYHAPQELEHELEPPDPEELDRVLDRTIAFWRRWSRRVRYGGPDAEAARRSALVLKALTYAPTGALVAAPTTSLPETPDGQRTYDYRYAWIRDAVLAARSLARLGCEQEADDLRRFMERSCAGGADDLQVLFGVGGERRVTELEVGPIRVGNSAAGQLQLDAYGHLVEQSWRWYERGHTPDDDYWRFLVDLVDAAVDRWQEPDAGLWEWRGEPKHFTYSKAMCWVAAHRGLQLAERCMRKAPEARWRTARDEIRAAIEEHGCRQGVFVQAFDEPELDAGVLRLPTLGFVDYGDERMVRTVDALRRELDDGGLLRRYGNDDGQPGREGAFLACTFWLVECLAHQGRLDDARAAFDRATATANDLGLFGEEFDVEGGLILGNYPQALSHLAHIEAALALADAANG